MKDSESDLLQKIDMLTRDNADLQDKVRRRGIIWAKYPGMIFGGKYEIGLFFGLWGHRIK